MDNGEYDRLSEVAYALNFCDQSHFIREVIGKKIAETNRKP